ncbi:TPA: porin, partial [Klebsiella aerogenes]|nr:porin [Klebsiella aerogenes]
HNGSRIELSGKINGRHYYSDNPALNGDSSYLRFGFKGETPINGQLTGYGQWQYQASLSHAEGEGTADSYTRLGFAGLKIGSFGSFDYGRNYGVMHDIGAWTDVLPAFEDVPYRADDFMFQRGNGMATYRNSNFFGLADGWHFAIQYQGKNDNPMQSSSGRDVLEENGDGWGLSTNYDFGSGLSAGAAMFRSDRTVSQNGGASGILGRGKKAEAYTGGLKYDANNVYLAATYTRSCNAIAFGSSAGGEYGYAGTADNWTLVTQYQFASGLRPSLAFVSSRGHIDDHGEQNLQKYVEVGTSYIFNKNMSGYVDYKHDLLDKNSFTARASINIDNVIGTGLVYKF